MPTGEPPKGPPAYAAAAGPPSQRAVRTDAAGLDAGETTIPCAGFDWPAYMAKPAGGRDLPVVLVAQEIFGLHEHIKDVCRRLAKAGRLAIAPDTFARHGDALNAPDIAAVRAIVARVPDSETMAVFDAALAFAATQGGDPARAAVTGFCWGGRSAWLYAAHNPRLRACIPWYGRLDGERTPNALRWPLDIAPELRVPTLGLYGGADPSIPADVVGTMRARLAASGAPAEIVVYDSAPHAFFADYRDSYREAAAQDAWRRMLAFLEAQGVA